MTAIMGHMTDNTHECHWCGSSAVTVIWERRPPLAAAAEDLPACDVCSFPIWEDARAQGFSGWRTVDGNHDLLETRRVLEGGLVPEPNGGLYNVRHSEKHQWYYLSDQTPEEVTFIQCCDSKVWEEGGAGAVGAPHTSFNDTRSPPEAPRRQSIEVRCLVFDAE